MAVAHNAQISSRPLPMIYGSEYLVYRSNGASAVLAKAMQNHFQLYFFNPTGTIADLEAKTGWAPAYADDLALRILLKEDLLNAKHYLSMAEMQHPVNSEPNPDRRQIINNLGEVCNVLMDSITAIDAYRKTAGLPPLSAYLN